MNEFQKAQNAKILSCYNIDENLSELQKAEILDIEKGGKRALIGEKRTFGGREYIKTAEGWKFHGKGTGTKAQEHAAGTTTKTEEKVESTSRPKVDEIYTHPESGKKYRVRAVDEKSGKIKYKQEGSELTQETDIKKFTEMLNPSTESPKAEESASTDSHSAADKYGLDKIDRYSDYYEVEQIAKKIAKDYFDGIKNGTIKDYGRYDNEKELMISLCKISRTGRSILPDRAKVKMEKFLKEHEVLGSKADNKSIDFAKDEIYTDRNGTQWRFIGKKTTGTLVFAHKPEGFTQSLSKEEAQEFFKPTESSKTEKVAEEKKEDNLVSKFESKEKEKFDQLNIDLKSVDRRIAEARSKGWEYSKETWKKQAFAKLFRERDLTQKNLERVKYGHSIIKRVLKELDIEASKYTGTAIRGYSTPSSGYEFASYDQQNLEFNGGAKRLIPTVAEKLKEAGIEVEVRERGIKIPTVYNF